jgi:hypothetical protein
MVAAKDFNIPQNDILCDIVSAIESCDVDMYPNVHTLISILLTLPVTTVSVECSFSLLRHLKSYTRGTIGAERLSSLALMSINHDIVNGFSIDDITNQFFAVQNRKV